MGQMTMNRLDDGRFLPRWTPEQDDRLRLMAAEGMSVGAAASALMVSRGAIAGRASRLGLQFDSTRAGATRWTAVMRDEMASKLGAGMTRAEVAAALSKQFGVYITAAAVGNKAKKMRRKAGGGPGMAGRPRKAHAEAVERPSAVGATQAGVAAQAAPAASARAPWLTVLDLGYGQCRWPMGQVAGASLSFRFCGGAAAYEGGAWCAAHLARVYDRAAVSRINWRARNRPGGWRG